MEQAALATLLAPKVAAGMVVVASPVESAVSMFLWRWMMTSPRVALLCVAYETHVMSPQRMRLPVNPLMPAVLEVSAGMLEEGGEKLSSTAPDHQLPAGWDRGARGGGARRGGE